MDIKEVIYAVESIEEEKRWEEELVKDSMIDELTRCYNRKAYEEDVEAYKEKLAGCNMVCASIDVNGLKAVNDDYGHAAGDELIRGAALCLKKCISSYGRIYRIGGDEFAAVFFADVRGKGRPLSEKGRGSSRAEGCL